MCRVGIEKTYYFEFNSPMTLCIGGNRTSWLFGTIITTQVVEGKFYNLEKNHLVLILYICSRGLAVIPVAQRKAHVRKTNATLENYTHPLVHTHTLALTRTRIYNLS